LEDIEPDDFTGAQVDQRGVGKLTSAADIRRAEADEAAGDEVLVRGLLGPGAGAE
jgi:hypothetical protein